MCSTKCVSPNGQIETEGIKAITQVTSKIDETVNSKFRAADEVVQRFQEALFNSLTEVDEFMNDVTRRLEALEHSLVPSPRKEVAVAEIEIAACMIFASREPSPTHLEPFVFDYVFEIEQQQYASRRDGEGLRDLQPPTDPSKKIRDDLEKVDDTTREKFDLLLKGLENVEDEFQGKTKENKKKRGKIQGKLEELQILVQSGMIGGWHPSIEPTDIIKQHSA